MPELIEVNLDALVGPTHHFGGLASGNEASRANRHLASNPRAAALQGLEKMKAVQELGAVQAVFPPQRRPDRETLARLGVSLGADSEIASAVSSSSSMWAANWATMAPSADTADGRVHFTPANLVAHLHRSVETTATGRLLCAAFPPGDRFVHHSPLPSSFATADEGSANHIRLSGGAGGPAVHLFVHGRRGLRPASALSSGDVAWARQTEEASQAVARLHRLDPRLVVHARQSQAALAAGAFHNDLVATGGDGLLLHHELAWADRSVSEAMRRALADAAGAGEVCVWEVPEDELGLDEAVRTYVFNSQVVGRPGSLAMLASSHCARSRAATTLLRRMELTESCPVAEVVFVDLQESMRNGGGPACLRMRCLLTPDEVGAAGLTFLTDPLYRSLRRCVEEHYRSSMSLADLSDPDFLEEADVAQREVAAILDRGAAPPLEPDGEAALVG